LLDSEDLVRSKDLPLATVRGNMLADYDVGGSRFIYPPRSRLFTIASPGRFGLAVYGFEPGHIVPDRLTRLVKAQV
jgi:hypothetical protein